MKLNKKKKGFTLIELMAVIAIVAVLAAVLVPTVSGYITRAKKTAVITQARAVMNAIETYNLSAVSKIGDNETLSSLADATNGKLGKDNFLTTNDIDKLGNAKVWVIEAINTDSEAPNKITLNGDILSKYDGTDVSADKPASN